MRPNKKYIKLSIINFLLFSMAFSQGFIKNAGITAEVIGGRLDVLNVYGPQIGFRVGVWPTSFLNFGIESTMANNLYLDNNRDNTRVKTNDDFYKFHLYSSLHLRIFKSFHPYIIATAGRQINYTEDDYAEQSKRYKIDNGASLKVGLSLEFDRLRISAETGGGSLGTGHVENNLGLSYAIKPLPKYKPLSNFNIKAGYHSIFPFSGPYKREDIPGFDIILETNNTGKIREYNAGIFFTDYIFSTGVFNIGTGWRLQGESPIFDYLDITPGIQVLIWAEGDPDFILPAASLGIGAHTELGKLIPFINTRTLLTYSAANNILLGTTLTFGLGYSF